MRLIFTTASKNRSLLPLLALMLAMPTAAIASSVYVEATSYVWRDSLYDPDADSFSGSGPAKVTSMSSTLDNFQEGKSSAAAGAGSVAAQSVARVADSLLSPIQLNNDILESQGAALARMTINDLVFGDAFSPASVEASINLHLSGIVSEFTNAYNSETYAFANNIVGVSGKVFQGDAVFLQL